MSSQKHKNMVSMAMTKTDRKQEEMKKAPTEQMINGKKNLTSDTSVPGIHIHPTAATAATTDILPRRKQSLCYLFTN